MPIQRLDLHSIGILMEQRLTTNSPIPPSQTVVTLQVLRGIAAILVVFAHAIDYQQIFVPGRTAFTSFYFLENFGAAGVDIFFIISGFIMAVLSPDAGGNRAAIRFAIKRIVRILPVYWLLTIVTAVLTERFNYSNVLCLISSFTFVPMYPRGNYLAPMILVGWSLSFEMYFYLAIAVGLLMRKSGTVVSRVAWLFLGLSICGAFVRPHGTFAAFALNPLLAEFSVGCLIGHHYRRRQADLSARLSAGLMLTGLSVLLATVIFGFGSISEIDSTMMGNVGIRRLLIWGVPSGLIVAGVVGSERRLRRLIPGAACLVGDASYSIYLIQLLVLKQFAMRWSVAGFAHANLFIPVAIVFTALAGIAHYGIIEKPLTSWLQIHAKRLLGDDRGNREASSRFALSTVPTIAPGH